MVINHQHSWLWKDGEKINYFNLKNLPKYFQSYDTTWSSSYTTWDFSIVTWFRPRRIDIKATNSTSNEGASIGTVIIDSDRTINNGCIYLDGALTDIWSSNGTEIGIIKQTASQTNLRVTEVNSKWFTLNLNNNTFNFSAIITAQQ